MGVVESRDRLNEALSKKDSELLPLISEWFRKLKKWESQESWTRAFEAGRIAFRVVNPNSNTTPPKIDKVTGTIGNLTVTQTKAQTMSYLDRSAEGIKNRLNPVNFSLDKRASQKTTLGLHDLPATLLDPARRISDQAKGYFSPTKAVYMPVPMAEDLILFYRLSDLAKGELKDSPGFAVKVQEIRNSLTRIKLAQSTDMGTGYVNLQKPNDTRDHIRYGLYGKITDPPEGELKPIARQATSEELKKRLENRVKYQAIISAKYGHNEIVLAYRSHSNPAAFPMYTDFISKADTPEDEKYRVVTSDGNPTGQWLADTGKLS